MVGLFNGVALAITCGIAVYLWSGSFGLALVIAVAMVMSMLAAGIAGSLVPIVLTRLGQDPATASSIILTTVTDVAGFFFVSGDSDDTRLYAVDRAGWRAKCVIKASALACVLRDTLERLNTLQSRQAPRHWRPEWPDPGVR